MDTILRELDASIFSKDIRDTMLDQMIDADQVTCGLATSGEGPHFAGYYQHVDDG